MQKSKGDGTDFESGFPDEQHLNTTGSDEGTDKSDGNDDDGGGSDDHDDDSDDKRTKSHRDEIPDPNMTNDEKIQDEENIDDEERMDEKEDDEVTTELYKDVNVNLGNEDTKMTDAYQGGSGQQNISQESAFEKIEEDAHVTLTPVLKTQKIDELVQSSFVSSDFTRKLLNLENPSPADNEIASLMETSALRTIIREEVKTQLPKILPTAVSAFATLVIKRNVTKSLEAVVLARSSFQPKLTYEASASLSEFELIKILLDKMEENNSHLRADYKKKLYDALVEFYNTNKDLFNTHGKVFTLKRSRDGSDKDQDPSTGSDRGTKRRKSSKEDESSKDSRSKEKKSSSTSKDAS
uniref:Uncharacterized protein n=1 Tax=Tanacetum cinerariifolium TaxID=118510 RepID=A0A6L2N9J7_TANCI|nr:hypothetical protein [Tanacetum cinerariifolium]